MSPPDPMIPATGAKLPAQTAERWRQIVLKAAHNGTDISQLVQHFAERAFDNKTMSLDSQGTKRRAMTGLRATLGREMARAKVVLSKHVALKKAELMPAYDGVEIVFTPPQKPSAAAAKRAQAHNVPMAMDSDTQSSKTSPLAKKITTTAALEAYIQQLATQATKVEQEMAQIDVVLNRGIVNHQATVAELSATSVELWRIAQEVLSSLPPPPSAPAELTAVVPTPMPVEKSVVTLPPPPEPAPEPKAGLSGSKILRTMQSLFRKKSPPSDTHG